MYTPFLSNILQIYFHIPCYPHWSQTFAYALCLISVPGTLVGMELSHDLTPVSFGPSRLLFATMTSADFSSFVVTAYSLMRPPRVRAYSFMLNRHLYLREFRIDIGLRVIWHSCPPRRPEVISVRRFNTLLSLLSAITSPWSPCESLILSSSGRIRDFHPKDYTHAEHTKTKLVPITNFVLVFLIYYVLIYLLMMIMYSI
jgi:hypothetical protein